MRGLFRRNLPEALLLALVLALLLVAASVPVRAEPLSPLAFLEQYGAATSAKDRPHHLKRHSARHVGRHRAWRARHEHSLSAGRARIRAMVAASARAHGVPVAFAVAIARVESGLRPRWNGVAAGVMQIRPATARSVGCSGRVHDLMEVRRGIECGMRYLALVWHHAPSRTRAAALYTQGIGARRISRAGAHYAHLVALAER